jgi:hypothetical protein
MLFPNTHIRFTRLDKLRLGGSAAGGLGIGLFGAASKLMAATNFGPYALAVALFGVGGIAVRQVLGFFNQHTHYMKVLAENLYFHSLADNRGAIALLANRGEEKDLKEEMLLYTWLANERVYRQQLPDLKRRISDFLFKEFDVLVDFEADDALSRLTHDRIVTVEADGLLKTLSPVDGIEQLDKLWVSYLQPHGVDRSLLREET